MRALEINGLYRCDAQFSLSSVLWSALPPNTFLLSFVTCCCLHSFEAAYSSLGSKDKQPDPHYRDTQRLEDTVTCKDIGARLRSQDKEQLETQCHGLNVVPTINILKPNPQCEGVWRWESLEVTKS